MFNDLEHLLGEGDLYGSCHPGMSDREILFRIWSKVGEPSGDLSLFISADYSLLCERYPENSDFALLRALHLRNEEFDYPEGGPSFSEVVDKLLASNEEMLKSWASTLYSVWANFEKEEGTADTVEAVKNAAYAKGISIDDLEFAEKRIESFEKERLEYYHDRTKDNRPIEEKKVVISSGPPKSYRADLKLNVGDLISHPTFGEGLVISVRGDKATLEFAGKVCRTLKCGL